MSHTPDPIENFDGYIMLPGDKRVSIAPSRTSDSYLSARVLYTTLDELELTDKDEYFNDASEVATRLLHAAGYKVDDEGIETVTPDHLDALGADVFDTVHTALVTAILRAPKVLGHLDGALPALPKPKRVISGAEISRENQHLIKLAALLVNRGTAVTLDKNEEHGAQGMVLRFPLYPNWSVSFDHEASHSDVLHAIGQDGQLFDLGKVMGMQVAEIELYVVNSSS